VWIASITVLPGEKSLRATSKSVLERATKGLRQLASRVTPPGLLGDIPKGHTIHHGERKERSQHEREMLDRLAERLTTHMKEDELQQAQQSEEQSDQLERDMHFYHYVLARECRNLQKDLSASPPRKYSWADWEYFLKLMGDEDDPDGFPGQEQPDVLVPEPLKTIPSANSDATMTDTRTPKPDPTQVGTTERPDSGLPMTDGAIERETEARRWERLHGKHKKLAPHPDQRRPRRHTTINLKEWSWLSDKSPLMATGSEAQWILERLSAALERELNRQRRGRKRKPPVSMSNVHQRSARMKAEGRSGDAAQSKEAEHLDQAARSEV